MKGHSFSKGKYLRNSENTLTKFKNFLQLFKFFTNKGPSPFPRGDNKEIAKIHWRNLKIFSRTTEPMSTKLGTKHHLMKETQGFKKKGQWSCFSSPIQCYDIIITFSKCVFWFKLVSQVSPWASCSGIFWHIQTKWYCTQRLLGFLWN